jgi:phage gpG-like protein
MSADEAVAALQLMLTGGVESATEAALAMGEVVEREVRAQLSKMSHAPGTPTPAPPGGPPAMISGALRDSVITKEVGPGHAQVGGTTVYARIQQLGGYSGRGLATYTPPRPYLEEALKDATPEAVSAAVTIMSGMIYRG